MINHYIYLLTYMFLLISIFLCKIDFHISKISHKLKRDYRSKFFPFITEFKNHRVDNILSRRVDCRMQLNAELRESIVYKLLQ